VTGGLLTLPRPSSAVRRRSSLQVDGSCSSVDVASDRHESEPLAVRLAVNPCSEAEAAMFYVAGPEL
jgi:hypothetical protein